MTTTSAPARDFAAEYLAAQIAKHSATDLTAQGKAEALARRIDRAAERADVYLDITEIGEQARIAVHGDKRWW